MSNLTRIGRIDSAGPIIFCTWDPRLRRSNVTNAAFNWLNLHSLVAWHHEIQWRARHRAAVVDSDNIITILVVSTQKDYLDKELSTQQKLGYGISIQPHDTIDSVTATCRELGWI